MMLDAGYDLALAPPVVPARRRERGRRACLSGAMAEHSVARCLRAQGVEIMAERWRGKAGEIDLICRDGDCMIFVEVKQAETHDDAALRLGAAQQARIGRAACEYCEDLPLGQLTEMRFDAALVDRRGRVVILENAFGDCFA